MAEHITVARPYARALFEQACADATIDDWQVALATFSVVIDCLIEQHVIGNPNLSDQQMADLCFDTLPRATDKKTVEPQLKRFIELLIREKRLVVVPEIASLFHEMVMEHNRIAEVDVVSASVLTDTQKQQIVASLEKRFNSKVAVDYSNDPSLIGGLVIKSDGWVFDGSIRSKLTRLAERVI